jgi:hypothetical protein
MRFIQYKAFSSVDASADLFSTPIDISSCIALSIQPHVVTGTPKGNAFIQISLDPVGAQVPANFVTVGTGADLTGSATVAYEYQQISGNWLRVYWNHTSSTGTLDCHVKTVGY